MESNILHSKDTIPKDNDLNKCTTDKKDSKNNTETTNEVNNKINEEQKYIRKLFEGIIGNNITFPSPFGDKQIIYTDFTASGRGIAQVENFISNQVLPFYANVHSSCGYLADQSEAFRREAKSIVRRYCKTDENNSIIFTGQGTTSCINKLIKLLNLKEYNQFHYLLSTLKDIYQQFKAKNLDDTLFEEINKNLIIDIKEQYSKLFLYTNYCYSNRWGGFDCIICRMNFTTEAQYNEHANNDIHKNNLKEANILEKNKSFVDEIGKAFNYESKDFIYQIMEKAEYFKPLVFVSRFEHNSNYLPWKETQSRIIIFTDYEELNSQLKTHSEYYIKMGTFTAVSNITGKYLNLDLYCELMHKYKGLAFVDYATGAPYLEMNMNSETSHNINRLLFGNDNKNKNGALVFKDAIFFSPHKFLGGVNTPGVLIVQQRCVRNLLTPSEPGGGTVLFATEKNQNYVKHIESREESGTPDIIGGVRIGLSLLLREKINHYYVLEMEDKINQLVEKKLFNIPNLHFLSDIEDYKKNKIDVSPGDNEYFHFFHVPIYSFLISFNGKFFHPNYISALLNDIFGIQSRPGCSCASLFGQYLLGIPKDQLENLEKLTCTGMEIFRPGYTRLNFPFFYPDYLIDYIIFAIEYCAKNAFKFLALYAFKIETGKFYHRNESEKKKWLNDIEFKGGDIIIPDFFEEKNKEFISEKVIESLKNQAIALADDENIKYLLKNTIGKSTMNLDALFDEYEKSRWFLLFSDVEQLFTNLKEDEYQKCFTLPLTVNFKLKCYPKKRKPFNEQFNDDEHTQIKTNNENKNKDNDKDKVNPNEVDDNGINHLPECQMNESKKVKNINNAQIEIPNKIRKLVGEASKDFKMIEPNDKILVGVSGGKDSLTLVHVLLALKRKVPFKIEIGAVTVDPQNEDYDPSILKEYFKKINVPYFYETDSIMKKAKQNLQNNSICSYCARMKRGIIYNCARREGYNVIALGQHLDDLAESFLMSVFHNGVLRTMKANYTIDAGDLRVIRPLIYCREKLFKDFAIANNLPVIQENCPACFSSPKERQRMKVLLAQQENLFPNLFSSLQKSMMPLMRGILKDSTEEKDDLDI